MSINEKLNEINCLVDRLQEEEKTKIQEAENLADLIVRNSKFNLKTIGPILADLYSIYKNEETKYLDTSTINLNGVTGMIILTNNFNKLKLKTSDFKFLLYLSDYIRFYGNENGMIQFYTIMKSEKGYKSKTRFATLSDEIFPSFLKDYIDYVISYRINHQEELKELITFEKLKELETEYLLIKKDELIKIYDADNKEEQEKLDENIARRKMTLKTLYAKLMLA